MKEVPKGLPFPIKDHLELVDLTGRCIRHDKSSSLIIPTVFLRKDSL